MKTLLDIAAPVTTFILLAAIGLEHRPDDFLRLRRQRLLVLSGVLGPLLILPSVAIALTQLFRAPADVTAAVLLVSACPIGSIANAYTNLARASTALSITLTGLSSLLASITIPLAGKGFELILARPFELQVPMALLAVQLVLILALPVMLGMWMRRRSPALAARLAPPCQRAAVVSMLGVLVLVIVGDFGAFVSGLSTTVPLAAAFVVASAAAGWSTATLIARNPEDRFAIASEFGARNVGVATAIAVTILGNLEFARFAATYAFVEIPLMLAAVALFRRSRATRAVEQDDQQSIAV